MSLKKSLARILLFAVLEAGALAGVPMTPDKIREILQMMNRARVEYVVKTESGDGDDPSRDQRCRTSSSKYSSSSP